MRPTTALLSSVLAFAAFGLASGASAQPAGPAAAREQASAPTGGGPRPTPPAEAVAACNGLKADQACSFTWARGPERGRCEQRDPSQPMACRPDRRPPPAESLAACKDRKAGDACAFTSPIGRETGTCVRHEAGSELGCRPKRNP